MGKGILRALCVGVLCAVMSVAVFGSYAEFRQKNIVFSKDETVLFSAQLLAHEEMPRKVYDYTDREIDRLREQALAQYDPAQGQSTQRVRSGTGQLTIPFSGPYFGPSGDSDEAVDAYLLENKFTYLDVLVHRHLDGDMTVGADRTIASFVELVVPKGSQLTVDNGTTLTIYGELLVEGTLVNNGTIVISGRKPFDGAMPGTNARSYYTKDGRSIEHVYAKSVLQNSGAVRNNGTVRIDAGELQNRGSLENSGLIDIRISEKDLTGLSNLAVEGKYKGSLTNTGTIQVRNTGGDGVANFKGASLDNQGTIATSKSGTVKGAVSGNGVVNAEN